ncbi:hypothetical protein [Adlercreutzia sp. ZJ154]|uniref:hypothetical protein n=1 Tax=Adlercreutzia sp. ZJ154 TaxID=2709790 RepID=UPI0013EE3DB9|nr:hypothetical protein [Adlercreutzia sp. ZJ154]
MKKTSKVLGAIGLSAALAIGCALPAFADDYEGYLANSKDDPKYHEQSLAGTDEGDGTTVGVKSYISNISVQVPLEAIVYADVVGGNLNCPSASVYTLTNNSTSLDLKVTGITWDYCKKGTDGSNASGWKIVNDNNMAKINTDSNVLPKAEEFPAGTDLFGNLYVTLKGADMTVPNPSGGSAITTGATMQLKDDKSVAEATDSAELNWIVSKQTVNASGVVDSPTKYQITMAGSNSQLLNQVKGGTHMEVFKVKYTFEPSVKAVAGTTDHTA